MYNADNPMFDRFLTMDRKDPDRFLPKLQMLSSAPYVMTGDIVPDTQDVHRGENGASSGAVH